MASSSEVLSIVFVGGGGADFAEGLGDVRAGGDFAGLGRGASACGTMRQRRAELSGIQV